jgi:hypothetical protein
MHLVGEKTLECMKDEIYYGHACDESVLVFDRLNHGAVKRHTQGSVYKNIQEIEYACVPGRYP